MKFLDRLKSFFTPAFFEQLFFFCLLIGLIPCLITLSDTLTPNLPSIKINLDLLSGTTDEWGNIVKELPADERVNSVLDQAEQSKKNTLEKAKDFLDNFSSLEKIYASVKAVVGQIFKLLFYGIPFTDVQRGLIALLLFMGILASTIHYFRHQTEHKPLYLVPALLLSAIPILELLSHLGIDLSSVPKVMVLPAFLAFYALSALLASRFFEKRRRIFFLLHGLLMGVLLAIFFFAFLRNNREAFSAAAAIPIYLVAYTIITLLFARRKTAFVLLQALAFAAVSATLLYFNGLQNLADYLVLFLLFLIAARFALLPFAKRKILFLFFQLLFLALAAYILYFEAIKPELFLFGLMAFCLILYVLAAVIALFYFMKNGHIRSKAFFASLLVIATLFGLPNALLFTLVIAMVRIPYLVIKQNLEIFRTLKTRRLVLIFVKSLFYWSPLLLFVIPGNKLFNTVHESTIDGIYTHIFKRDDSHRGIDKNLFVKDLNQFVDEKFKPLEGSRLDALFDRIENDIREDFDAISGEVGNQSNALPKAIAKRYRKEAMKGFGEILPYLKEEDCGFHILIPTSCCIMNGTKSYLKTKILQLLMEIGLAIEKDLARALKEKGGDTQADLEKNKKIILERLNQNRNNIKDKIAQIKSAIKSTIMGVYNGVIVFKLIMDLLLFILIVKSFLVVFARVAFSGKDDIYVTLLEADQRMSKGEIRKHGSEYIIPSSSTKDFYTSRTYEPSGRPPKFTIPQKTAAVMGRIRTGNYALNHIIMRDRKGSVYYHALGGTEFVEWILQPGEEVIFHFDHFVAMSEDIRLTTTYSFRLTSLLLGRFHFTTAKGPGRLVLLTKGKPVTSTERQGNASVPVSRIIAFQKNTRFHVHSELNFVDVFMSSIYLQKKPSDLIVIDADERGNVKSGISRFIKSFLLPI